MLFLPSVVQLICDPAKLLFVNVDLRAKMLVDSFHLDHLEKEVYLQVIYTGGKTGWIFGFIPPAPATCSSPR